MDDEVIGGWHIDPATRLALRLDRVKKALDAGDFGGAVLEAEELLDEEPEHAEGLFLLAEALLELGDAQSAADTYVQYLAAAEDGGDLATRAGALAGLSVARFECIDLPGAVEAARESLRIAPDLAETHYYLGLALERMTGGKSEALSSFVAANRLDPQAYPLPIRLDPKEWKRVTEEAHRGLPPALQAFWTGVPIELIDLPDLAELRASDPPITPTVSGLYVGDPPEEGDPWTIKPSAIRLYIGNLARLADRAEIIDEIGRTLQGEALDWLGLQDEDLSEDA